ncbi:YhcN/YlaJ family sporulation lipoprotein [Niallia sp. 03133]|uniref:YhcN/YlaJ family sporulation lipoprotein n=1 Tax=Niallia sp. 03133 TaxID=3458060 RepID=UPI0040439C39
MTNKKIFVYFTVLSSMLLMLSGCEKYTSHSRLALFKIVNQTPIIIGDNGNATDQEMVKKIKAETESFDSIYDVAVIKGKKDILVAYKVKHLKRLQMKKIEKRLKDKLEKKFPDQTFTVSSDLKIFLETARLWEKTKDPNFTEKQANKRLKQIIRLNNELT